MHCVDQAPEGGLGESSRIRLGNGDGNWPVCADSSEPCWEKNRRVEVWTAAEVDR